MAIVFLGASPAAATDIAGDLVITGSDVRSNETINITGSVIVSTSGSLDWQDVELVFAGTGQPGYGFHLDGAAVLYRVTFRAGAGADPYVFLVNSTATLVLENSDVSGMAGVGADPGGSGAASSTSFAALRGGIQIFTSQARVGNSTIHDGEGALLTVVGASPRIYGNYLHSAGYLEYLTSSSYDSGSNTQYSFWRAVAACIVLSGSNTMLDTNRVEFCGVLGSANATDVGSSGASEAVSTIDVVAAGVVAMGGAPSFRLHASTEIGQIPLTAVQFTLPGPVNVTQYIERITSWGVLLQNTGDVTVSGGFSNNANIAFEGYLDASYSGASPTIDIGPYTVNASHWHGFRFTVDSVGVGVDITLNQVSVTGGTGAAVSVQFIDMAAAHALTISSSVVGPSTGSGIYVEDTGSSVAPSLNLHHNTLSRVFAPLTVRMASLSAGAAVAVHNNTLTVTSGIQNFSCCSGDEYERGAIDIQAFAFTGGTLNVRVEDNRVYNQTWLLFSEMYPGVMIYHQGSVNTQGVIAVVRNDISNVSHGIRIYENYGSNAMNSTYIIVGNRVSISDGHGLYLNALSFLGQLDPIFQNNIFDRPGADRSAGYGVYWQVTSAAVINREFGNNTVYGNGTRTIYALFFYYLPTTPWRFTMDRLLITNSPIGLYLLRSDVSVYNSNVTGAQTAVQCQECTARLLDTEVYTLSATVTSSGEVTAYRQFGSPRVQWQGDGGLTIPSGNIYLLWRGAVQFQTLMTIPFTGARIENLSVPSWKRTLSQQDEYANLTPMYRQGGVELPGVLIIWSEPYYGPVTILDPELPTLTYTTPAPDAQIRARTVTVKGRIDDATTGVAGVQFSTDGVNFTNVTNMVEGNWETVITFPADGKYNITLHGWDRARWAITNGNFSTGFKEVVIGGVVIDTVAPIIIWTSPLFDRTQNSTFVDIGGQVLEVNTPLAVFRVTFNGYPLAANFGAGGIFSYALNNLTEGPNQISVVATDRAGNTNIASRTVTLDTIPPHLVVLTPLNGSSTNRAVVSVTGEVEAGVVLKVNGLNATLPYPVNLNAGQNVITIVATDLGLNVAIVTRVVFLDTLAPTVTFVDPPRFPYDTRQARVIVQASASEPLKAVTLNGITYPLAAVTTFAVEIYLEDGTHTLTLSVTDLANNTGQVTPRPVIRVDTVAPTLTLASPPDGTVQKERLIVVCGKTDPGTALFVTIPPNRFQIQLTNPLTGDFCHEESRTADGDVRFTFEALDTVGNTAFRSLTVSVDTQAPDVEVIGLGTNFETTDNYVQLRGRVSPDSDLTVNGTPIAVVCNPSDPSGFCDFDMLVPISVGQSTLTVLATDEAGNTQVRTFNILREGIEVAKPVDLGTPLMLAGVLGGLALFALIWVRAHRAAEEANPGLGGDRAATKKKERKRAAAPPPEVIYEIDSQAMYRDDVSARSRPRPPR